MTTQIDAPPDRTRIASRMLPERGHEADVSTDAIVDDKRRKASTRHGK